MEPAGEARAAGPERTLRPVRATAVICGPPPSSTLVVPGPRVCFAVYIRVWKAGLPRQVGGCRTALEHLRHPGLWSYTVILISVTKEMP